MDTYLLSAELLPSSLPELLHGRFTQGAKDRFYRISDKLLTHKDALEKHLRERQGALFQVDRRWDWNCALSGQTDLIGWPSFQGVALRW